jgi:hypothetical protein
VMVVGDLIGGGLEVGVKGLKILNGGALDLFIFGVDNSY